LSFSSQARHCWPLREKSAADGRIGQNPIARRAQFPSATGGEGSGIGGMGAFGARIEFAKRR